MCGRTSLLNFNVLNFIFNWLEYKRGFWIIVISEGIRVNYQTWQFKGFDLLLNVPIRYINRRHERNLGLILHKCRSNTHRWLLCSNLCMNYRVRILIGFVAWGAVIIYIRRLEICLIEIVTWWLKFWSVLKACQFSLNPLNSSYPS